MKRSRQSELKYHVRYFASLLVKETEAEASGYFDSLKLTYEEQKFIDREMLKISSRIFDEKHAIGRKE